MTDYNLARPDGSNGPFERVLAADYPTNEDGSPAGDDDVWLLEHSGWKKLVEFMEVSDD